MKRENTVQRLEAAANLLAEVGHLRDHLQNRVAELQNANDTEGNSRLDAEARYKELANPTPIADELARARQEIARLRSENDDLRTALDGIAALGRLAVDAV